MRSDKQFYQKNELAKKYFLLNVLGDAERELMDVYSMVYSAVHHERFLSLIKHIQEAQVILQKDVESQ